jgi:hypothetical protein
MDKKIIVLTTEGHGEKIDNISVSLFDSYGYSSDNEQVSNYCNNINNLELKADNWIHAQVIHENQQYPLRFLSYGTMESLLFLDDRAVQKVMRGIDTLELAKAMKAVSPAVMGKVTKNMSSRARKMFMEDMEYMGSVRKKDNEEAQNHILEIIRHLEDIGEIVLSRSVNPNIVI